MDINATTTPDAPSNVISQFIQSLQGDNVSFCHSVDQAVAPIYPQLRPESSSVFAHVDKPGFDTAR